MFSLLQASSPSASRLCPGLRQGPFPFHPVDPEGRGWRKPRFINTLVIAKHIVLDIALLPKGKLTGAVKADLNGRLENLWVVRGACDLKGFKQSELAFLRNRTEL